MHSSKPSSFAGIFFLHEYKAPFARNCTRVFHGVERALKQIGASQTAPLTAGSALNVNVSKYSTSRINFGH